MATVVWVFLLLSCVVNAIDWPVAYVWPYEMPQLLALKDAQLVKDAQSWVTDRVVIPPVKDWVKPLTALNPSPKHWRALRKKIRSGLMVMKRVITSKWLAISLELFAQSNDKPLTGRVIAQKLCDESLKLWLIRAAYPPFESHLADASQSILDFARRRDFTAASFKVYVENAFDRLVESFQSPKQSPIFSSPFTCRV